MLAIFTACFHIRIPKRVYVYLCVEYIRLWYVQIVGNWFVGLMSISCPPLHQNYMCHLHHIYQKHCVSDELSHKNSNFPPPQQQRNIYNSFSISFKLCPFRPINELANNVRAISLDMKRNPSNEIYRQTYKRLKYQRQTLPTCR